MKILTLGKLSQNKDEAKAMIEKLGGKLTGSANKASLCISTKSEFNGLVSLANVRRVCVCVAQLGFGLSLLEGKLVLYCAVIVCVHSGSKFPATGHSKLITVQCSTGCPQFTARTKGVKMERNWFFCS